MFMRKIEIVAAFNVIHALVFRRPVHIAVQVAEAVEGLQNGWLTIVVVIRSDMGRRRDQ